MKIDRQIGILSMLLQKDTLTAPYLAEQFEVSRRTINSVLWSKQMEGFYFMQIIRTRNI